MLAGRLEEAHALAERALALARRTRNAATRRMPCASWATLRRGESLRSASTPKPTTARPSPWPRSWACARSRPTATTGSERSTKIGHHEHARAELSAAIALYRAMDMTFWLPEAEAALAQVEGR